MKTESTKIDLIKQTILFVVLSVFTVISVLPGYSKIGSLFTQIAITFAIAIVTIFIFDLLKIKPSVAAHSVAFFICFWVLTALVLQVKAHIDANDYSFNWIYLFYYDKFALIYITAFTYFFYYIFKLFIKHSDETYTSEYYKFSKEVIWVLSVFYIITLIYCFIICRVPSQNKIEPNLIPFEVIKNTFLRGFFDYELLFLFFGNILIFLPLGFLLSALFNNKYKIILFIIPIFFSLLIETLQYFLKMGQFDVDDIILNVIGFYFGIYIKKFFDYIVCRISKGKIKSIL